MYVLPSRMPDMEIREGASRAEIEQDSIVSSRHAPRPIVSKTPFRSFYVELKMTKESFQRDAERNPGLLPQEDPLVHAFVCKHGNCDMMCTQLQRYAILINFFSKNAIDSFGMSSLARKALMGGDATHANGRNFCLRCTHACAKQPTVLYRVVVQDKRPIYPFALLHRNQFVQI